MGRHAAALVDAARVGGADTYHTETFEDTVAFLLKAVAPGDLVLVKGSRGMRMERIVDALVARLARTGQG
jgi:UDP-N-acetylmuramyl pentapeptide synthase